MPRFVTAMSRQTLGALRDLAPIFAVIAFFQIVVLQQPFPDLVNVLVGLVFVVIGLALFIQGLESGLFPLGEALAQGHGAQGQRHGSPRHGVLPWLRHDGCRARTHRRRGGGGGRGGGGRLHPRHPGRAGDLCAGAAPRGGVLGRAGNRPRRAAHHQGLADPPLHHRRVHPRHADDGVRARGDRRCGLRLGRRHDEHDHGARSSPRSAWGSRRPYAGATRCWTASASSHSPA